MQPYQVSFNGNRIDTIPGVYLYFYDFTRLPQRQINIHKLARKSLSIVTSSEYTQKEIPVFLDICSGTRQDTEATVTEVKSVIQAQNGTLKVLQAGIEVQYTVTMNEFNIEWNANNAYVQIVFLASSPIGTASNSESLFNITGITLPSGNQTFVVEGSFLSEPTITVVINTVTGGSPGTINLINAVNNQGISVTSNFTAGSILEVNSRDYTVTLNGANLDYTGLFPTFAPGSQQVAYSDTFTTRSVDVSATYNQKLI